MWNEEMEASPPQIYIWMGGQEFQQKEKENPRMKAGKPLRISCNTWPLLCMDYGSKESCFQFCFIQMRLYVERNLKQANCLMPRQLQPEVGPPIIPFVGS